jgi:hypothetical protein
MSAGIPSGKEYSTSTRRFAFAAREIAWAGLALGIIGAIGALKLLTPFDGDQALFLYFAQAIDQGERLYVDVWDMKQPGIFWFYWLGGKMFGFSEFSVKLLELGYLAAFAFSLIVCLRRCFHHRWLSSVVAIAALGSYYAFAGTRELTQVEIIISLPVFLSAWLLAKDYASSGARMIGRGSAGLFAGIAVTFKLFYAPIFIAFVLVAILEIWRRASPRPQLFRAAFEVLWPFTIGVLMVLGAVSLILWRQGLFDELLWNSFVYPLLALGSSAEGTDLGRLARNVSWMLASMGPWLLFALVAVSRVNDAGEPAIMRQMLAWLLVASVLIALQSLMFWKYHFLLLFVPIAVLAGRGIDLLLIRLAGAGPSRWLTPAALSLFFVLPAMASIGYAAQRQAEQFQVTAVAGGDLEGYRRAVGRDYGWIREHLSWLRNPAGGEPIYVFGDPLIYLVVERRQAIPVNGWSWEAYPAQLWQDLPGALAAAKPGYIFVDHVALKLIPEISPQTDSFIASDYALVLDLDKGRLYARRSPPPDVEPDLGWHPKM